MVSRNAHLIGIFRKRCVNAGKRHCLAGVLLPFDKEAKKNDVYTVVGKVKINARYYEFGDLLLRRHKSVV